MRQQKSTKQEVAPKYLTTREAAELANVAPYKLWHHAGRELSQPVLISPKRALWLLDEVLALKAHYERRLAMYGV